MWRRNLLVFLILWAFWANGCGSTNDLIVAKVGGRKITLGELRNAARKVSYLKGTKEQLLQTLINKYLLILEAENRGLDKDPKILRQLEKLKAKKMLEEFRNRLLKKINISESEIRQYYHQSGLDKKTETRASHIMVKTREEAEAILDSLRAGADFAKLARKYSLDTASAGKGGDLGYWEEGKIVGPSARKVFSMKVGEISEPFQTPGGWHIFKVVDRRPVGFEKQKPMIKEKLTWMKLWEKEKEYKEKLRKKFNLTINPETLSLLLKRGEKATEKLPPFSPAEEKKILLTFQGGKVPLGYYLNWLKRLKPKWRPAPCDSSQVVEAAKALVTDSVLLPEVLYDMGIDRAPSVRRYLTHQKEKLIVEELKRQVVDKKIFTPEAIEEYYQKHREDYLEPETIKIRSTLLRTKQEAQEVFNEIKKGTPMAQVVRKRPPSGVYRNYDVWSFYVTDKAKKRFGAVVEEAAKAKVGELRGPFKVTFERRGKKYTGYGVLQVLQKKKAHFRPLNSPRVLKDIRIKLRLEKRKQLQDLFAEFVSKLREKYSHQIIWYQETLGFF